MRARRKVNPAEEILDISADLVPILSLRRFRLVSSRLVHSSGVLLAFHGMRISEGN